MPTKKLFSVSFRIFAYLAQPSCRRQLPLYLPLRASNSYHKQAFCPITPLGVRRGHTWTKLPCSPSESQALDSSCPRVLSVALTWDVAELDARWSPRLNSWGTAQVVRAPPLTSSLMTQPWLRASVLKSSCGQGRICRDRQRENLIFFFFF